MVTERVSSAEQEQHAARFLTDIRDGISPLDVLDSIDAESSPAPSIEPRHVLIIEPAIPEEQQAVLGRLGMSRLVVCIPDQHLPDKPANIGVELQLNDDWSSDIKVTFNGVAHHLMLPPPTEEESWATLSGVAHCTISRDEWDNPAYYYLDGQPKDYPHSYSLELGGIVYTDEETGDIYNRGYLLILIGADGEPVPLSFLTQRRYLEAFTAVYGPIQERAGEGPTMRIRNQPVELEGDRDQTQTEKGRRFVAALRKAVEERHLSFDGGRIVASPSMECNGHFHTVLRQFNLLARINGRDDIGLIIYDARKHRPHGYFSVRLSATEMRGECPADDIVEIECCFPSIGDKTAGWLLGHNGTKQEIIMLAIVRDGYIESADFRCEPGEYDGFLNNIKTLITAKTEEKPKSIKKGLPPDSLAGDGNPPPVKIPTPPPSITDEAWQQRYNANMPITGRTKTRLPGDEYTPPTGKSLGRWGRTHKKRRQYQERTITRQKEIGLIQKRMRKARQKGDWFTVEACQRILKRMKKKSA